MTPTAYRCIGVAMLTLPVAVFMFKAHKAGHLKDFLIGAAMTLGGTAFFLTAAFFLAGANPF